MLVGLRGCHIFADQCGDLNHAVLARDMLHADFDKREFLRLAAQRHVFSGH